MLEVNLETGDLPLQRFYRSPLFGCPRGNLPRKILCPGAFLENYRTAPQNSRLVRAQDLFHLPLRRLSDKWDRESGDPPVSFYGSQRGVYAAFYGSNPRRVRRRGIGTRGGLGTWRDRVGLGTSRWGRRGWWGVGRGPAAEGWGW